MDSIPSIWHDHPRLKPGQCSKVWNKCTKIPYSEYKLPSFFKIHLNFLKFQHEYLWKFNDFKSSKKFFVPNRKGWYVLPHSYGKIHTELTRSWSGSKKGQNSWHGRKQVLNRPDPVEKGVEPISPGGKRWWSGVTRWKKVLIRPDILCFPYHWGRTYEVNFFFWNFLNDPIRKNKQKKFSSFTLEIPSQHGHRSLRYNFQEKISCLSIFRTK